MDKIGFGEQAYLVYKHLDAGHPHVHLVTTNIKADGKAITLHNLAKVKSKNARLEIEKSSVWYPPREANSLKFSG